MRKTWMSLLLLLFCTCMLAACGSTKNISGKIIETNVDDDLGMVSFVVRTDEDKDTGILITDKTSIFSFVEGMSSEAFKACPLTEVIVSADCEGLRRSLFTQDGNKIKAYTAKQVIIRAYLKTETAALADGTAVNIWQYSDAEAYTLQDGMELLRVQNPIGPKNVHVGGIEGFDDLEEAAQKQILAFYQDQGQLYDVQDELKKAYEDYLKAGKPSQFDSRMIRQATTPTASNERLMYFLTSVLLPIDGTHEDECRIGAAFDRTSGEHIDNSCLLSCSREKAIEKILDIAGVEDPVLRAEMEKAFQPENMTFFPEQLEICFQPGTLPSQECAWILALDYDDRLAEILCEWAIPEKRLVP